MATNIGEVIAIEEYQYQSAKFYWQNILKLVNGVIEEYNALALGKFDEKVLKTIVSKQSADQLLAESRVKYSQLIAADTKNFKSSAFKQIALSSVDAELASLRNAVERLFELRSKVWNVRPTDHFEMSWDDCMIIDEKAVLNEANLKKRYSYVIETEDQSTMYSKMQEVQKAWNALREYMIGKGFNTGNTAFMSNTGLFYENDDCSLGILPFAINHL